MIRIGIIVNNTEKNNKEYVDFIICSRITSVNNTNRNNMQLCVQVHVYFPVLVNLMQSLLLRQKSQILRRHQDIIQYYMDLFFKIF